LAEPAYFVSSFEAAPCGFEVLACYTVGLRTVAQYVAAERVAVDDILEFLLRAGLPKEECRAVAPLTDDWQRRLRSVCERLREKRRGGDEPPSAPVSGTAEPARTRVRITQRKWRCQSQARTVGRRPRDVRLAVSGGDSRTPPLNPSPRALWPVSSYGARCVQPENRQETAVGRLRRLK